MIDILQNYYPDMMFIVIIFFLGIKLMESITLVNVKKVNIK